MASDSSNSDAGWRVDTVKVFSGFICCGGPPAISAAPPAVLTAESYNPANDASDPGETVTVNLPLTNMGGSSTTNLVGTLQSTGGVSNPSSPQSYGVIGSNSRASQPCTFTVNASCGRSWTLTLALSDGATNLCRITYGVQVGANS